MCFDGSDYDSRCLRSSVRCNRIYHHFAPEGDGLKAQAHLIGCLTPKLIAARAPVDARPVAQQDGSVSGTAFSQTVGIGRSYFSPASRRVTVRPPFKPCMRISRTRLTGGRSGRRITQPPGTESSRASGRVRGLRRRGGSRWPRSHRHAPPVPPVSGGARAADLRRSDRSG